MNIDMNKTIRLMWMLPTFLTTIGVFGAFSQPWIQTKVGILTISLLCLAVGYVSYLIFFTKTIAFKLHFLHVGVMAGVLVTALSIILSQDIQYSLYGPTAAQSDSGVLVLLALFAVLILPQLGRSVYVPIYRGLEIAVSISALYTLVLQVIPFGREVLEGFWGVFGFETFPAVLIAPNITSALIIYAIVNVGLLGQGLFEFVNPKRKLGSLVYYVISFLINFALMTILVGESSPVFAYLIQTVGALLLLIVMAQKGLLLQNNRITRAALFVYVVIAISVVSAIFSPTISIIRSQVSFIHTYTVPVSFQALKENPFIGSGPGTISLSWNKFYSVEFNYTSTWDEQKFSLANEFLDILVQYGIIGLVITFLIALGIIYFGYLSIIKQKLSLSPIYYISFVGLILIGLISLLSSWSIMLLMIGTVLLSIFIGEHFQSKIFVLSKLQVNTKDISPTIVSFISFLGIFIYIGVIIYGYTYVQVLRSDVLLQRAVRAEDIDSRTELSSQALDVYGANLPAAQIFVQTKLVEINQILAEELPKEQPDTDRIQSEVEPLLSVINQQQQAHPNDFASYDLVATVYSSLQQQIGIEEEEFEEVLGELEKLAPNDPRVDIYRANYNIVRYRIAINQSQQSQEGQEEEQNPQSYLENAKQALDRAIEKKRDFSTPYITYETIFQLEEDPESAATKLEEYLVFVSQNRRQIDTDLVTILAQNYIQIGRLEEAEAFVDQLISSSPESAVLYYLRGQIDEEREQFAQAVEWYQLGLQYAPENEVIVERIQALGGEVPETSQESTDTSVDNQEQDSIVQ
jgi:tetratricopeptide (TPR) repeat protein